MWRIRVTGRILDQYDVRHDDRTKIAADISASCLAFFFQRIYSETIVLILRISTLDLKSNWSFAPLLNVNMISLSMSRTPAVSMPKYRIFE